ncbi:D-alanyl-lipoteichoic acid biosynthesis protein DltD [Enterobacter sp. CC120223-11]|uniref:D-alanyl-lipoteichoic acid biosynthesis protein DltD n=1 Tax=Enterobacter sp. CC120223-11 TaxID=1378073 RepID=UPI000BC8D5E1|nr:D-alanyl-lipoteichoic acid biosynthesis protein DltD [Enterobacter sp. CC120223-11]SNY59920.1 D-alanine transfer protein [Enterobacter sp. CC120223-11]
MMKVNKNIILHITMAFAAVLVLCIPPLWSNSLDGIIFQPMISSMTGSAHEQREKMMTLSHALKGNAIFFLGASEVSWSEDEHYAVYNYFNKDLHIPVVAYGGGLVESLIQFSLLTHFKKDLSNKTKMVLLLSPDNFYRAKLRPDIFEDHVPASIIDSLLADKDISPSLKTYFSSLNGEEMESIIWHKPHHHDRLFGLNKSTITWEFGHFCDQIKNYYKQKLPFYRDDADSWSPDGKIPDRIDWVYQRQQAMKMTADHHVSAATHWVSREYAKTQKSKFDWSSRAPDAQQMAVFEKMIGMLHRRHVNVVVIVDPINPWVVNHPERFKAADDMIAATLKKYQIPYFDMYKQPYQNGWNKDYLHPTDLAWVDMDHFIYEHFQ